jgi:hypothetical protein
VYARPSMKHDLKRALSTWTLMLISMGISTATFASSLMDEFTDPTDGQFDASNWLLEKRGFLLNPFVITEPAIGYGGGATLLFFHEGAKDKENREEGEVLGLPPSISFLVGGGTETNSWLAGGGHFGSYLGDRIRYLGGVGYGEFNIDFYIGDRDIDYTIKGVLMSQQLLARIVDSDFFLGGRYVYTHLDSEFDFGIQLPSFIPDSFTFDSSGVGPVLRFDSRDNIFTANRGLEIELAPIFYTEALGSDANYQLLQTTSRGYAQVHDKVVLALRVDTEWSFGDTPFFALPAISARGVPATRYQNEYAVSSELQGRWNVWKRWSLIGFVGLGWSGGDIAALDDSEFVPSGGGGFRYLIARLLNLQTGMDFAGSDGEFVFYFQIGTGW